MTKRFSYSALVGIFTTLLLFYIMQALIATSEKAMVDSTVGKLVDFVRIKQDEDLQLKQRKAKKPPPPDEPPPQAPPEFNVAVDDQSYTMANLDLNVNLGAGGFGISDGEYLPIFKVQPMYPRRAQARGMSGWAIVEFTVTEQGSVKDAFIVANCAWIKRPGTEEECEGNPSSIFDSAARKAALKFKYKPKVIDGTPVDTAGVQNKITFKMEES